MEPTIAAAEGLSAAGAFQSAGVGAGLAHLAFMHVAIDVAFYSTLGFSPISTFVVPEVMSAGSAVAELTMA